jgi:hypothetical protein
MSWIDHDLDYTGKDGPVGDETHALADCTYPPETLDFGLGLLGPTVVGGMAAAPLVSDDRRIFTFSRA